MGSHLKYLKNEVMFLFRNEVMLVKVVSIIRIFQEV